MLKSKIILRLLTIIFIFISFIYFAGLARADSAKNLFFNNLKTTAEKTGHDALPIKPNELPKFLGRVVGMYFLALIGILFLALLIYGGIVWMTSRGNETEVTRGRNIIFSGLMGMVVILLAYVITYLVSQLWSIFSQQ